jgi:hypothetical protein
MCGSRHEHRHRRGGWSRRRYPNREELLERLEEHQRDLEQEVADVADLIRRLREEQPAEQQPATI